LRVGDGVVLYFTDIGGIFRASSGDGLNFGAPVKVIEAGSNSAIFPLSGGGYRMIYNPMFPPEPGQYHQSSQYFLSARSADGLNWVLEEGVRFRSADAPDYDGISVPCVVDIGNGRLRMYFVGDMYGPELGREGNNIRSTLSSDEGLSWQREDGVRIERTSMDPAVIKTSEGYWLYFTAPHEDKKFGEMRVYAVFSSDGLVFDEPRIVLTPPNAGERFMDPEFIETENEMRMYVSLASGEGAAERTKLVSAVLKR
jgi:predicted GH43/DUF377 family glycosyl hydrolase